MIRSLHWFFYDLMARFWPTGAPIKWRPKDAVYIDYSGSPASLTGKSQ